MPVTPYPESLANIGNTLYFAADDGSTGESNYGRATAPDPGRNELRT